MTYAKKLQNPKWQKCRLEVLNRDSFTCCLCSDTETELHVHHKEYEQGKEPWEYELDNFLTLCAHCHTVVEILKKDGLGFPVAANKQFTEDGTLFLNTICADQNNTLGVIIGHFHNGTYYKIIQIRKPALLRLIELIQLSEKLIEDVKQKGVCLL